MNTKKQKKQKQLTRKNPSLAVVNVPHLSPCATSYLRALSDPWTMPRELPCIPDVITLPSRKFQTKARGVFTIGSGGVGWVIASPFLTAASDYGIGSGYVDKPVIYTSSATYAGTTYTWSATGSSITTTGVSAANAQSPMTYSALAAAGVQIRLVGGGLRIKYTGTELNRGGRLVLYRSRSNAQITQGWSATDFLSDPTCYTESVTRSWKGVTYLPDSTDYLDYNNSSTFQPSVGLSEGSARRSLIAFVEGAVSGTSFEYEVTSYFELIGPNQQATQSHADPTGFGAIMSALPERVTSLGSETYASMERGALKALETTTSGLFQIGSAAVATSLAAYLRGSGMPSLMAGPGPVITEL